MVSLVLGFWLMSLLRSTSAKFLIKSIKCLADKRTLLLSPWRVTFMLWDQTLKDNLELGPLQKALLFLFSSRNSLSQGSQELLLDLSQQLSLLTNNFLSGAEAYLENSILLIEWRVSTNLTSWTFKSQKVAQLTSWQDKAPATLGDLMTTASSGTVTTKKGQLRRELIH